MLQWAFPFNTAVDTLRFPTYRSVVEQPMDFGTIKSRLDHGQLCLHLLAESRAVRYCMSQGAQLKRDTLLLLFDHESLDSSHVLGQSPQANPCRILQVTTLSLLSLRQTCGWSLTTLGSSILLAQMCSSWLVMSR